MNPTDAFNAGVPAFGTWVLYSVLVAAACALALALRAAGSPPAEAPRWLRAARYATLGTCVLIVLDVLLLLYAFVSHDFRIRYVMRYSDRSMPTFYLLTALWGGQDGSLLWWTFLLATYTGACTLWLRGKYKELAPWVLVTLNALLGFFVVIMAFAANPFSANVAGAPPDGEGLNPALQNFYMAIHPPSLYTGFVGCAVPFAFSVAALVTGRLDSEWLKATRKWLLFAWLFLSIGNTLGMLWAYEELGWGGYWAWDPVENAACIPWFTTTALLHSSMIQERRGTLKLWNVVLALLTYFLTIFGTFLTRSGLIASIHSFAQSGVGIYFVYYMAVLAVLSVGLVAWRWRKLQTEMVLDSVLSREAMFVANNWLLLGICLFICVATVWPKISEWLWNERVTVGASFYNFWLPWPGILLLVLMGVGTLTPWRKGSRSLLWKSFRVPLGFAAVVSASYAALAGRLEMPMVVPVEPIYPSAVGRAVAALNAYLAPGAVAAIAFNLAALAQEFFRGTEARVRSRKEFAPLALWHLVARNRRRYGGYIVHIGVVVMFIGWLGAQWKTEAEASLRPGERFRAGHFTIVYQDLVTHRDPNKREVYARVEVLRDGRFYTRAAPARFTYTTHQENPTSEVSITSSATEDLYLVLASVNDATRTAHLKAFVNPLVIWIWLGALVVILGTVVAMWPEVELDPSRAAAPEPREKPVPPTGASAPSAARNSTTLAVALALGLGALGYGGEARAQHGTTAPAPVGGNTEAMSPAERHLFDRMLCMCGDCQRLPLATCTCDFAARTRANMRAQVGLGASEDQIVREYVARYGVAALAVPPDENRHRGLYLLPAGAAVAGALFAVALVRRWSARGRAAAQTQSERKDVTEQKRQELDQRIDEELRGLDE